MTKYWLTFFIFILLIPIVSAQDSRSYLLDMLEAIPDSLDNRDSLISYMDYRAMEAARPGVATYESWSDFMASNQSFEAGLYTAALRGISSGPDFANYIFRDGELWQETVGFDFMDIDRALTFGNLPTNVTVIVGDFETDAISATFAAQDYTLETLGDYDLWCGAVGCENGMTMDLANRNTGNPFGGDLGRQQPIMGSDTMLITSPALSMLTLSEEALSGERYSLADDPSYVAAVNSINPDNILIQANFIYFTQIVPAMDITAGIEVLEARMEELTDLPQYELVLIADTATDTEQVVLVTLVYSALEDAETATVVIPERLATMESLRVVRPLSEVLELRGINEITATAVLDEESDLALAIFEFHAPLASSLEEDIDSKTGIVPSSQVYRLFIDLVYSRDTDWLIAGTGDS